jgi:hypothetical protein
LSKFRGFLFGGYHTLEWDNNQLAFLKIGYQDAKQGLYLMGVALQVKLPEKRTLHRDNFQPKFLPYGAL